MSWFRRKKPEEQEPFEAAPETLGVIIHVMPKDFYGADAMLRMEPKPLPLPPPVPVAPPTKKPELSKSKRKISIVLWVVIGMVLLFAASGVLYIFLTKGRAQPIVPPVTAPATLPVVETPKEPAVSVKPSIPQPSKDTDSDGLTDIEEMMYGTDARNPDSDKDTFLDGNEVFHRYDPNGLAPSTLLDTGAVKMFNDPTLPWTVYYPASWKVSLDAGKKTATFKTPNLANVTITSSSKDVDLGVEDWLLKNIENIDVTTLKSSYTVNGYYNLRSKNDLVDYLDLGDTVYIMTYDLNGSLDISYLQTFAMMVNSFYRLSP